MTAQHFRPDNTEGYTQAELDRLNRQFEERTKGLNLDPNNMYNKSELDWIGERLLAEFDTESS